MIWDTMTLIICDTTIINSIFSYYAVCLTSSSVTRLIDCRLRPDYISTCYGPSILFIGHITVVSHKRHAVSNHRQLDCSFKSLIRLARWDNRKSITWPEHEEQMGVIIEKKTDRRRFFYFSLARSRPIRDDDTCVTCSLSDWDFVES